ncbi:hypothetical protein P4O66_001840 [Electrophorus voltai]|uniref:Reverse transcriptase domain-containing protein n=1 Tax=Electrophorus voltai TaxID=2609070 RepID=A0AAD9DR48_9TELE|nr:hypothetical protein P4O66_001840 [Electrophorus voltai]
MTYCPQKGVCVCVCVCTCAFLHICGCGCVLTTKLEDLGLHTSLCDWISNFITDKPQSVQVGNFASSTLTLRTGAPQGCVLSPLLYSLYTYDCTATSNSTIIVKFADDTVVMGLISDNDERAYLEETKHLENWCQENNLLLKVSKTKELIMDCSKKQGRHYQPDLYWSCHNNSLAKKARQRLYHLRRLRDFRLPSKVLRNFYTCTIESILTGNITVWFGNSTKQDRQAFQRVVRSAERITHTELPDLQTIYYKRCQTKARRIVKDPTHPNNRLFSLLRTKIFATYAADGVSSAAGDLGWDITSQSEDKVVLMHMHTHGTWHTHATAAHTPAHTHLLSAAAAEVEVTSAFSTPHSWSRFPSRASTPNRSSGMWRGDLTRCERTSCIIPNSLATNQHILCGHCSCSKEGTDHYLCNTYSDVDHRLRNTYSDVLTGVMTQQIRSHDTADQES